MKTEPHTVEDICPACNGIGEHTLVTGQTPESYDAQNVMCDQCNGTGHVIFTDTGIKFK